MGAPRYLSVQNRIAGHAMYESCKICTPYVCQGMPGHVRSKMSWLIEDKWPQKLFKRRQKGHKYIYQAFVVAWKFVLTENRPEIGMEVIQASTITQQVDTSIWTLDLEVKVEYETKDFKGK